MASFLNIHFRLIIILLLFICRVSAGHTQSSTDTAGIVIKSIYPVEMKNKSKIYNRLWGEHYRTLYSTPIHVQALQLDTLQGGVQMLKQAKDFHGLLVEDKTRNLYMLRPLGGSTSFMESSFFQEMYRKSDFRDTYTDTFIKDAYTMINPYTFIAAASMAETVGLPSARYRLFYLPAGSVKDTIADGSRIQDKIVAIVDIPDIHRKQEILTTPQMLDLLLENKANHVNQEAYIRTRLFDILIGDWNKIPENWNWIAEKKENNIEFTPIVIDRNHGFTKVDGLMFKQLLNILTLGFIYDYHKEYKNIKKFNYLGYTLDVAVAAQSTEQQWLQQAGYLKTTLTDEIIKEAFNELPTEIQGEEIELLKQTMITRRNNLEELTSKYYKILQQNPVITASRQDDKIHIDRSKPDSIHIHIYNPENNEELFHKAYERKNTEQIWLYGLEGNDSFEVTGKSRKEKPIYLVGGKGNDQYRLDSGKKLRIYEYKAAKDTLNEIKGTRIIYSDNEKVVGYDYDKTNYHTASFSPWGFYDSDLGINLGAFFTYTKYGFKRLPFTYQHRIGFNYLSGFMYRGIFPLYNEKQTFIVDANFGFPKNVYNFFGFGNKTDGYKEEDRDYNQVNIREFKVIPSFRQRLDKYNQFTVNASFEIFKPRNEHDRFINTAYSDNSYIFDTNLYSNIGLEYEFSRPLSSLINHFEVKVGSGWRFGLNDLKRNYPWSESHVEIDFAFSRRFTWATKVKGQVIYNNKYEFFQAASPELRGYRGRRFIGKQSIYESSDFRFDMGTLKNPFIPLKYGLFAGMDCGRVWYPGEDSQRWHVSYGGGCWLIILNKITTKYSIFGSSDTVRFMLDLGLGF